MKKVAAYYISGIVCIGCFAFLALTVRNHSSFEAAMPIVVIMVISGIINNLTKHSVHEAARDLYNDLCRTSDEERVRERQENIRRSMEIGQEMHAQAARQADEAARQTAEDARLSSTGIEFGGYNPDPNLNPSMHSQQDSMTNMNSFNNGSGMF